MNSQVVANELKKMDPQSRIIFEILQERGRQDLKFGADRDYTNLEWMSVLTEEVGEAAQALNDVHFNPHLTVKEHYDLLVKTYRIEMIQVAAVAIAAVENLDRRVSHL